MNAPRYDHFQRLLTLESRRSGVQVRRLMHRVSAMVVTAALGRSTERSPEPDRFVLKGGTLLELRFDLAARVTKDIDYVFLGSLAELGEVVDAALETPYAGFTFSAGPITPIGLTGAQRIEVRLTYDGNVWGTIRIECSLDPGRVVESEPMAAHDLSGFGLEGPSTVPVLALRYQLAQKLHAMTERPSGRENDRVRDLVDVLLIRELSAEPAGIRAACVEVFGERATHAWPPVLAPPSSWGDDYAALRRDIATLPEFDQAVDAVQRYIDAIDAAR